MTVSGRGWGETVVDEAHEAEAFGTLLGHDGALRPRVDERLHLHAVHLPTDLNFRFLFVKNPQPFWWITRSGMTSPALSIAVQSIRLLLLHGRMHPG